MGSFVARGGLNGTDILMQTSTVPPPNDESAPGVWLSLAQSTATAMRLWMAPARSRTSDRVYPLFTADNVPWLRRPRAGIKHCILRTRVSS